MSGVCTVPNIACTRLTSWVSCTSLEPKLAFFFLNLFILLIIIKKESDECSCQTEPAKGNYVSDTAFTDTESLKDH